MTMSQKKFTPQQKAAVALAALKGDKTVAEISSIHQVHDTQIRKWKRCAEEQFTKLFVGEDNKKELEQQQLIDELYRVIGKRDIEIAWLKKKLQLTDA